MKTATDVRLDMTGMRCDIGDLVIIDGGKSILTNFIYVVENNEPINTTKHGKSDYIIRPIFRNGALGANTVLVDAYSVKWIMTAPVDESLSNTLHACLTTMKLHGMEYPKVFRYYSKLETVVNNPEDIIFDILHEEKYYPGYTPGVAPTAHHYSPQGFPVSMTPPPVPNLKIIK